MTGEYMVQLLKKRTLTMSGSMHRTLFIVKRPLNSQQFTIMINEDNRQIDRLTVAGRISCNYNQSYQELAPGRASGQWK